MMDSWFGVPELPLRFNSTLCEACLVFVIHARTIALTVDFVVRR